MLNLKQTKETLEKVVQIQLNALDTLKGLGFKPKEVTEGVAIATLVNLQEAYKKIEPLTSLTPQEKEEVSSFLEENNNNLQQKVFDYKFLEKKDDITKFTHVPYYLSKGEFEEFPNIGMYTYALFEQIKEDDELPIKIIAMHNPSINMNLLINMGKPLKKIFLSEELETIISNNVRKYMDIIEELEDNYQNGINNFPLEYLLYCQFRREFKGSDQILITQMLNKFQKLSNLVYAERSIPLESINAFKMINKEFLKVYRELQENYVTDKSEHSKDSLIFFERILNVINYPKIQELAIKSQNPMLIKMQEELILDWPEFLKTKGKKELVRSEFAFEVAKREIFKIKVFLSNEDIKKHTTTSRENFNEFIIDILKSDKKEKVQVFTAKVKGGYDMVITTNKENVEHLTTDLDENIFCEYLTKITLEKMFDGMRQFIEYKAQNPNSYFRATFNLGKVVSESVTDMRYSNLKEEFVKTQKQTTTLKKI